VVDLSGVVVIPACSHLHELLQSLLLRFLRYHNTHSKAFRSRYTATAVPGGWLASVSRAVKSLA